MDVAFVSAYVLGIAAVLGVLPAVHARGDGPNEAFAKGRRSPWLAALFPVWGVVLAAIVAAAWALRLDHLVAVLQGEAPWPVKAALVALVACEAVVVVYWLLYVRYCALESRAVPAPATGGPTPRVLLLVPTRDEPAATLERSVGSAAALDWPDLRVVVVDTSRTGVGSEAAASVCARFGVERLVVPGRGGKAAALNDAAVHLGDPTSLLCVLDADQRVRPDLLRVLVARLVADDGLAFVQSAQGYENTGASRVTRGAAQQEMLLYDAIAGGRGALGRAPCCGTNFVMRRDALASVGGWDEATLSEDQVTAFHLHRAGWRSAYHREMLALGLGPLDLGSYWHQQFRWAHGSTRMAVAVLTHRAPLGVFVDTLWSSGFYALTLVLAVLGALPVALALAGQPTATTPSWLALSVYPLYALVMLFPYAHMALRGYRLRDLLLVQGLLAVSVPVYARAVGTALIGGASDRGPTPRGASTRPWWRSPALVNFGLLVAVGPALAWRAAHGASPAATAVALAWTALATISAGHYFLFLGEPRSSDSGSPGPRALQEAHPGNTG